MIPLADAHAHVLQRCPVRAPEHVALARAQGLVLGTDLVAGEAVPPFANSAMDGFAVRAGDTVGPPVSLRIVETVAAGRAPTARIGPGEAARIFTGAPMPGGADAVVMVERTTVCVDEVTVEVEVAPGNHVRSAGDDIAAGDTVFTAGEVLGPGHLGVLASLGHETVSAHPRLRVGVCSTGDELREGPAPLLPGQIRDSNRVTLLTMLAEAGFEPVDLGIAADEEAAIEDAIGRGVRSCDAVLTSGGVSMGDLDLVKVVLDRIGDMAWMQVAIKPAKPFAFGLVDRTPVFGLPGNPVSSMVSFEVLARPALRRMAGHRRLHRLPVMALADEELSRRPDGKTHFARVVASHEPDGRVHVRSAGGQGSHQLAAMARANALAVLPDGEGAEAGADVEVMLMGP